jgi:organic radical activating enzyme
MMNRGVSDYIGTRYLVIESIDLSTINQSTGSIYRKLTSLHRFEYQHNERIVFYCQHAPSQQLADHIQRAAKLVDISNFFILIFCGEPTQHLFDLSHRVYGDADSSPIVCEIHDIDSGKILPDNFLINEQTLCPMPWMHLAVSNTGHYAPCCVYQGKIGSVSTDTMQNIFHGTSLTALRRELSDGKQPVGCSHCWNLEKNGLTSNRQNHLSLYRQHLLSELIDNPTLQSIDIKAGNICNFKCRICSPASSSSIAVEKLRYSAHDDKTEILSLLYQGRWFDHNKDFLEQLINLLPNLINIDFYGGEPLLLKNIYLFLELAIQSGDSDHIRLHINTNGSVYPEKFMPLLKKFQSVDIAVSIDDTNQRFELQRGGSWKEIQDNINKLKSWADSQLRIYIMPTVNIQNVLYLESLFFWASEQDLNITLNYLDQPTYLCVDYMTDLAKELVVSKYKNHNIKELSNLAKRISASAGSNGQEFVEYMSMLDQRRHETFADTHREIASAMGYQV